MGIGVVEKSVGSKVEFRVLQMHTMAEYRLFVVGCVLPPHRSKGIERIADCTARVVVCNIAHTVVVKTIGSQDCRIVFSMYKTHVAAQAGELGITIVEQFIAVTEKGVALHKPHMPECVKRVFFLVEISRVAVHQGILVAEDDIPPQNLRISNTLLVETERFGVLQIHHCLRLQSQAQKQTKHYDIETKRQGNVQLTK